ncbi:YjgN family protein [Psychrobacter sp.]|uniref:YjgN family protein n=1 Tax=Psychrobacter sp. TaxID=56811 RepID=UPI0025D5C7A5|nr:YjgN family protein [Psychrobacter sp.]
MKHIEFKGTGGEYFKIWIVNVLLCILTLGIYYPWAKVRTNRYFYANTTYLDRFFDYHATGKQLFLGYLIAMFILIVIVIINQVFPMAGFILPIVIFAVMPWIIWRSLKFTMRVTSFSNVRFSFKGALKTSYFIYMLIPVVGYLAVVLLILGSLFPLMQSIEGDGSIPVAASTLIAVVGVVATLGLAIYLGGLFTKKAAEYQVGQTKYGQGNFFIDIKTGTFVKIAFKTALVAIGCYLVLAALFAVIFSSTMAGGFDPEAMANEMATASASPLLAIGLVLVYFGFIAAALLVAAYSYSRQRQYIYDNTTLDKAISFKSTVSAKRYFIVLLTNMLLTIVTLGLALPWAKVRVARYLAENTWIEASDMDVNSYLTQKEKEQSAIGEEIGDILDIDMDIAL